MKRRDSLFRAATHSDGPRSIRYDVWPALAGGRVEIRRYGTVVHTGVVELVMPDSSALWLETDPMHDRRYFSKNDGYQAWISPRDLQTPAPAGASTGLNRSRRAPRKFHT
jgi:hypothetical protein